jgi:hypothetical protein
MPSMKNLDLSGIKAPDNLLPSNIHQYNLYGRNTVVREIFLKGAKEGAKLAIEAALRMLYDHGLPKTASDLKDLFGYEEPQLTLSERGLKALETLQECCGPQSKIQEALLDIETVLTELEGLENRGEIKTGEAVQSVEEAAEKPALLNPVDYPPGTWFRRDDGFAVKSVAVQPGVLPYPSVKVGGMYYNQVTIRKTGFPPLLEVIERPEGAPEESIIWSIGDGSECVPLSKPASQPPLSRGK